jgi:hypothetical protein
LICPHRLFNAWGLVKVSVTFTNPLKCEERAYFGGPFFTVAVAVVAAAAVVIALTALIVLQLSILRAR